MQSKALLVFGFLLVALLAGCAGEAPAATGPKQVSVRVTDASGQGLPYIDVAFLTASRKQVLASASTDDLGRATLVLANYNPRMTMRFAADYSDEDAYDLITDALPSKAFEAGVNVTYALDRYASSKSLALVGRDPETRQTGDLGGCLLEWLPDDRSHDYVGARVSEGSIPGLIEVLNVVQGAMNGSCLLPLPDTDAEGRVPLVSVDVGGKTFKALGRLAAASLDMSFNENYAILSKKDLLAGAKEVAGDFGGPSD